MATVLPHKLTATYIGDKMNRKQLETRLQFNVFHADHKKAMSDADLAMLVNAGYVDVSWGNDECASFMSPCGYYQVFYGDDHEDAIYAQYICDEGYQTPITLTNDMSEALAKVKAFI